MFTTAIPYGIYGFIYPLLHMNYCTSQRQRRLFNSPLCARLDIVNSVQEEEEKALSPENVPVKFWQSSNRTLRLGFRSYC